MAKRLAAGGGSPSERIDARIRELGGWRGEALARARALVRRALPDVVEEWKWDVPVWSRGGILCTGEAYKQAVKLTFARGASLPDPAGLFTSSKAGKVRRAIDIRQGDALDEAAFIALVQAAAAANGEGKAARKPAVLLTGGNPQIAKGDGDAPVQAWIDALPGWKRELGRRVDALIVRALPDVRKAVKWNSPFYGVQGQGWFLGIHAYTRYLKLAFFRGTSLRPPPPGASKSPETRYLDIHEGEAWDEGQLAHWVRQAAALPGWIP